ncbi:3'-5' exonuclease [Kineobactrum salinum]|uniref:DNA 3'-5' helicase n=1 Tax=Kineobactrum salinum TaxID=2708301 RepID=A0A6C0TZB1_9GAMM|nr:3'-5' exonuclease [Kineobactrum salinum]QIB65160.1 UvrD-helicase domain-containing protein [Kineobactrum salinum]
MEFRIADTFTDSLAKLTGGEQKAVKTTAFDLQMNPENPGFSFHKLDRAQDKNFWSIRVNRDIRIIVHRSKESLLLCYVDHHDNAYKWAEKRKLERHPKTGAAQLVEIRERVEERVVPVYIQEEQPEPEKSLLYKDYSDDDLLSYGVPPEWLKDVKTANEDTILDMVDHLPSEASEALLEIAVGGTPKMSYVVSAEDDPFAHPDAERRFRVMKDVKELEQALDAPWEKWSIFLHPDQKEIVEKNYSGPARVSGSAGTGKTIVALHRSVHLAKQDEDARVLLSTFSDSLANALHYKLSHLIRSKPKLADRLEVLSMNAAGLRLYKASGGRQKLADDEYVRDRLRELARKLAENKFSLDFIVAEWSQVVDAWQLKDWDSYKDVSRLGRKTRLSEAQRLFLWDIYKELIDQLEASGHITMAGIFFYLAEVYSGKASVPFDYCVIDEAQDINIPQLKFLSALGGSRDNALFFAGDLGQRIFQQPFSWKSLGVDIRGRSKTLRVNYRTSHQIRAQADKLLGPAVSDVDGNVEDRTDTVSVFNGPDPLVKSFDDPQDESDYVAEWLVALIDEGYQPHEIGVIVRSENEIWRARAALEVAQLPFRVLDEDIRLAHGSAALSTMHFAKGLEFRGVAVMACDDEIIPLQQRIESVTDNSDLKEVYETERHLLYVACTRARDRLLVTSGDVPSEFLEDIVET